MELKDTVALMNSADYKDRFVAEYMQVKTRYDKLHRMIIRAEAGTLDFTPSCPLDLLKEQARHMGGYLHCLEVRAEIEHIDLELVPCNRLAENGTTGVFVRDPRCASSLRSDSTSQARTLE